MRTLLLAGILTFYAAAQTPTEPPLLIQVIRAPGSDGASIRPYLNAVATNVLGMRSVTGVSETWLIEAHDSFVSIEELDKAISAGSPARGGSDRMSSQDDLLAPSRTLVALYRPNRSYRPDEAIRMFPKARYFHISLYRIRPGADGDFGELVRQRRYGFERTNLDRPDIAYQVISGAPSETYVFLAPLTSLKTLDDMLARMPASLETGARPGSKIAADIEISREHLLFRVDPQISWVSQDFVSADPEFWEGKRR